MKEYKTMLDKLSLVREKSDIPRVKIKDSSDSAEYIRQFYHEDMTIYESFFMVLLNNANNTTGYVKISQGGITGTIVDVRILAKYAVEGLATCVIIAHNHPSGNLIPSSNDKDITKKIKETLQIFDCKLLDHIILTENSYFSFTDEGFI